MTKKKNPTHIFFNSDSDSDLNENKDKNKDKNKKKKLSKKKDEKPNKRNREENLSIKDDDTVILDDNETKDDPKKRKTELLLFFPKSTSSLTPSSDSLTDILKKINEIQNKDKKIKENKDVFVCKNKKCNHSFTDEEIIIPKLEYIDNLSQLIELGKSFHCKKNRIYNNINLRVLHDLIEPLSELESMIGLNSVKDKIVDQLLYFLQGYHNNESKCGNCIDCTMGIPCLKNQSDMLHTCICGPPGVGKTELGRVFGKIYRKLGILTNDTFKIFTRSELVGEYLGQTAVKTQKCIDECKGGVMFIDEAYSLGNEEKRDSFSKECIDTINQNLSERRDFLCIIAGYKDSLEKCFFKYNDGLNRRFTFRYDIEPYKWNELKKIFELKVKKGGFNVYYDILDEKNDENKKIQELFKKHEENFVNSGGDMETLFLKSKIIHSRTILNDANNKYILSYNDIKKGMDCLISTRELLKKEDKIPFGMYL